MFARRTVLGRSVIGGLILAAAGVWLIPGGQSNAQPPAPLPAAEAPGQEVLTQGPVHEAFAEPTTQNPVAPLAVPKQPPDPVEEMPPDMKPEGQNVVWVPGYWAWDDTRNDFLWISGIWRDAPPNHAWVPGYWSQAQGGFQWTPGVWTPTAVQQVNYLSEPPQSRENGPTTPAPSANDFWVPGTYRFVETRYVWQPGYWTAAQPDWIWIPAHYVWSPSGYLFIPGHWDYTLERRGVLFAPVYFTAGYYRRPGFFWGPSIVIDPGVLTASFFVRPGYCHYYFGDCYGPNYVAWGFRPWFAVGVGFGYDPLFTYYRWHYERTDPRWAFNLNERYRYYNAHPEARPPRTYAASVRAGFTVGGVSVALSLNQYARRPAPVGGAPLHFTSVSVAQRQSISRESIRSADVARERARLETAPSGRAGPGGVPEHRAMNLSTLGAAGGGHLPGAGVTVGQAGGSGTSESRYSGGRTGGTSGGTSGGTTSGNPGSRNPNGRTPSGTPGTKAPGGVPALPFGRGPGNGGNNGKSNEPKNNQGSGNTNGRFLFSPLQDPNSNALHRLFGDRPKTAADGKVVDAPTPSGATASETPKDSRAVAEDSKNEGDRRQLPAAAQNSSSSAFFGRQAAVEEPADADASQLDRLIKDPIRPLTLSPFQSPATAGGPAPAVAGSLPMVPMKDPIRPLNLVYQGSGFGSVGTAARASGAVVAGAPPGKDPVGPLNLVSPPAPFGFQGTCR